MSHKFVNISGLLIKRIGPFQRVKKIIIEKVSSAEYQSKGPELIFRENNNGEDASEGSLLVSPYIPWPEKKIDKKEKA